MIAWISCLPISFFQPRWYICLIPAVLIQLQVHLNCYTLVFPLIYSELCVVVHVSSLSSKRKMASIPSKSWTRDKTSKASGMSWNLPHSKLFFKLPKQWSMLLSVWIIPLTEHCPSWDITWCNYGSKKGGVCVFFSEWKSKLFRCLKNSKVLVKMDLLVKCMTNLACHGNGKLCLAYGILNWLNTALPLAVFAVAKFPFPKAVLQPDQFLVLVYLLFHNQFKHNECRWPRGEKTVSRVSWCKLLPKEL